MALDCRKCEELLPGFLYGELDEPTATQVAAHLEHCATCRDRERDYRSTLGMLEALRAEEVPEETTDSIRQALSREMLLAVPSEIRAPRRAYAWGFAAAAAVLLAIGAWIALSLIGSGPFSGTVYADVHVQHLSYELTVFNDDLALVKDRRHIVDLHAGLNLVQFADVAERIDPTSVRFESQTDPLTTKVLEQNYEFDLATPAALLRKYIDKKIVCVTKDGQTVEGYLASCDVAGGAGVSLRQLQAVSEAQELNDVYQNDEPTRFVQRTSPATLVLTAEPGRGATSIVSIDDLDSIRLDEMPKGLLVKPTLVWKVQTARPGPHDTTLIYQTAGFSWNADYVVTVGEGDVLDWQGWVTVSNNSGTSYPDAKLKLIAGEVHRVQDRRGLDTGIIDVVDAKGAKPEGKAFEEKAFFEYHLYTLSEPTTLNNSETKQLKLLKAEGVKAQRRYVFDANANASRALVELEVWNKKENRLGMPLPKGHVRFRQLDPDAELEYVGEDSIDHTPKDEKLTLNIGAAFDVTGERIQRSQTSTGRTSTQSYVIKLRNHKSVPIRLTVREHPGAGAQWNVTVYSMKPEKIDQNTLEFYPEIPANGEVEVSYTIRHQW